MNNYEMFKCMILQKPVWYKWNLMGIFKISYTEAENILKRAVSENLLVDEDYYHRFVTIISG